MVKHIEPISKPIDADLKRRLYELFILPLSLDVRPKQDGTIKFNAAVLDSLEGQNEQAINIRKNFEHIAQLHLISRGKSCVIPHRDMMMRRLFGPKWLGENSHQSGPAQIMNGHYQISPFPDLYTPNVEPPYLKREDCCRIAYRAEDVSDTTFHEVEIINRRIQATIAQKERQGIVVTEQDSTLLLFAKWWHGLRGVLYYDLHAPNLKIVVMPSTYNGHLPQFLGYGPDYEDSRIVDQAFQDPHCLSWLLDEIERVNEYSKRGHLSRLSEYILKLEHIPVERRLELSESYSEEGLMSIHRELKQFLQENGVLELGLARGTPLPLEANFKIKLPGCLDTLAPWEPHPVMMGRINEIRSEILRTGVRSFLPKEDKFLKASPR